MSSSWFKTVGGTDGWFSSMFAGTPGTVPGTVTPSVSDMIWNLFEGKDIVPAALELSEIPKLPRATDLPEFDSIPDTKYVPPEPETGLEDLDFGDSGIRLPRSEILKPIDTVDPIEISRILRKDLEDIIGSEIPVLEPPAPGIGESWRGFDDMYDLLYDKAPREILDKGLYDADFPAFDAGDLARREGNLALEFDPSVHDAAPFAADDFAASHPLLDHGAAGLEDLRPFYQRMLFSLPQTENEMLLAARQAVRAARAGLSAAEYTPMYLAGLDAAEATSGILATLKAMTWGQIAEGVVTGALTAGFSLGLNFLGDWLLRIADENEAKRLKELGIAKTADWEAEPGEIQRSHNPYGNVGYVIMGDIAYPCTVNDAESGDSFYIIVFDDVFQFTHQEPVLPEAIGFFTNDVTGKTMKKWDMPTSLRKQWLIRNMTTSTVIPYYPIIKNGTLIRMKDSFDIGTVVNREAQKFRYRIKGIKTGVIWYAVPSQFDVRKTALPEAEPAESIAHLTTRFEKMFHPATVSPIAESPSPPTPTPPVFVDRNGIVIEVGDVVEVVTAGFARATVDALYHSTSTVGLIFATSATRTSFPPHELEVIDPDSIPDEYSPLDDDDDSGLFTVDRFEDRSPVHDRNANDMYMGDQCYYNSKLYTIVNTYADIYTDVEWVDLESMFIVRVRSSVVELYDIDEPEFVVVADTPEGVGGYYDDYVAKYPVGYTVYFGDGVTGVISEVPSEPSDLLYSYFKKFPDGSETTKTVEEDMLDYWIDSNKKWIKHHPGEDISFGLGEGGAPPRTKIYIGKDVFMDINGNYLNKGMNAIVGHTPSPLIGTVLELYKWSDAPSTFIDIETFHGDIYRDLIATDNVIVFPRDIEDPEFTGKAILDWNRQKPSTPFEIDVPETTRRRLVAPGQIKDPHIYVGGGQRWDWVASWTNFRDFSKKIGISLNDKFNAIDPHGDPYLYNRRHRTVSLKTISARTAGGRPKWRAFTEGLPKSGEPTGALTYFDAYTGAFLRGVFPGLEMNTEAYKATMDFFMIPADGDHLIAVDAETPPDLLKLRLSQLQQADGVMKQLFGSTDTEYDMPSLTLEIKTVIDALKGVFANEVRNLPPDIPVEEMDPNPGFVQANDIVMVNAEQEERLIGQPVSQEISESLDLSPDALYLTKAQLIPLIIQYQVNPPTGRWTEAPTRQGMVIGRVKGGVPDISEDEVKVYCDHRKVIYSKSDDLKPLVLGSAFCPFCLRFPGRATVFKRHLASEIHMTNVRDFINSQFKQEAEKIEPPAPVFQPPAPVFPLPVFQPLEEPAAEEEERVSPSPPPPEILQYVPPPPPPIPVQPTPWNLQVDPVEAGRNVLTKHALENIEAVKLVTGGVVAAPENLQNFFIEFYQIDVAVILDPHNEFILTLSPELVGSLRDFWEDLGLNIGILQNQNELIEERVPDVTSRLSDADKVREINATYRNFKRTLPDFQAGSLTAHRQFTKRLLELLFEAEPIRAPSPMMGISEPAFSEVPVGPDLDPFEIQSSVLRRARGATEAFELESPQVAKRQRRIDPPDPPPPAPLPLTGVSWDDWVGPLLAAGIFSLFAYMLIEAETPVHRIR